MRESRCSRINSRLLLGYLGTIHFFPCSGWEENLGVLRGMKTGMFNTGTLWSCYGPPSKRALPEAVQDWNHLRVFGNVCFRSPRHQSWKIVPISRHLVMFIKSIVSQVPFSSFQLCSTISPDKILCPHTNNTSWSFQKALRNNTLEKFSLSTSYLPSTVLVLGLQKWM